MAKVKTIFCCQQCGAQYNQWQGQCIHCQDWNTISEEKTSVSAGLSGYSGSTSQLTPLHAVPMHTGVRIKTNLSEFDHVLGGGLVSDSVVLMGGDPGIGKSTLLLQIQIELAQQYKTLYVSGEESLQQIALRAARLGRIDSQLTLLSETHVERILMTAQQFKPQILVIDSIQTMHTDLLEAAPGSVGQVRESAAQLVKFAKTAGIALFIVGHVTKEGAIAGPRVLEHMVDVVLYFENGNDHRYRVIRAVKNRFGAVNEIGIFAMTDRGLKQVNNPSAIFLSRASEAVFGSSVLVTWEGSRPLLVEVQALVDKSHLANPRRVTVGLDSNRLSMLLAVLHRHGRIMTYDQDVFVNAVGGLKIMETAADLAILLSVLSSLKSKSLGTDWIVFGEVGLSGEVRPVPSGQARLREAAKHGFCHAIVPKANVTKEKLSGIKVYGVQKIEEALDFL